MSKKYFEDFKKGESMTYPLRISEEQIRGFLDSVNPAYRDHMQRIRERHGVLVPPHLIPGAVAAESMRIKEYPGLALAWLTYEWNFPVRAGSDLIVVDKIIGKRPVCEDLGELLIERAIFDGEHCCVEAVVNHRIKTNL